MINKCQFCGKLFESEILATNACPACVAEARNNFPPEKKQKKFVESDGFFDKDDYLSEEKRSGFFESSEYNTPNR